MNPHQTKSKALDAVVCNVVVVVVYRWLASSLKLQSYVAVVGIARLSCSHLLAKNPDSLNGEGMQMLRWAIWKLPFVDMHSAWMAKPPCSPQQLQKVNIFVLIDDCMITINLAIQYYWCDFENFAKIQTMCKWCHSNMVHNMRRGRQQCTNK